MSREIRNILSNRVSIITFFAFTAIFVMMNVIVPYFGDDLYYHNSISGGDYTSIWQVVGDAFREWGRYKGNGRIIVMFFTRFYSGYLSDTAFTVINTVVFLLLVLFTGKLIFTEENQKHSYSWTLIFVCLFSLSTGEDYLFYWASGSAGYIISSLMIVTWLLLLRAIIDGRIITKSPVAFAGILFISFALAFQHEGAAVPLSASALICLLLDKSKDRFTVYFIIAFAFGSLINVLSPGLLGRFFRSNSTTSSLPLLKDILVKSYYVLTSVRIGYILILALLFSKIFFRISIRRFIVRNKFMFLCALFALLPPLAAGQGGRAVYFSDFFSSLLLIRLLCSYWVFKRGLALHVIGFAGLVVFATATYYNYFIWQTRKDVEKVSKVYPSKTILYNQIKVPFIIERYVSSNLDYCNAYHAVPKDVYNAIINGLRASNGREYTDIVRVYGGWLISTNANPLLIEYSHLLFKPRQEDGSPKDLNALHFNLRGLKIQSYFVSNSTLLLQVDSLEVK